MKKRNIKLLELLKFYCSNKIKKCLCLKFFNQMYQKRVCNQMCLRNGQIPDLKIREEIIHHKGILSTKDTHKKYMKFLHPPHRAFDVKA